MSRYFVGPEPAGESALGAVQAAVLVGEQLGKEPAELEEFLREFTGAALSRRDDGDSGVDFGGGKCDYSVKTFSGRQG